MPLNLIKVYNQLLELLHYSELDRQKSLTNIFNRDIKESPNFCFKGKPIYPTKKDNGEEPMDILFKHLTTVTVNGEKHREFDLNRSQRLHWLRHHIDNHDLNQLLIFSIYENSAVRTYIYDKNEAYVIILENLRKTTGYYLLTAYYLIGKDKARDKIIKKYERRLSEVY